MTPSAWRRLGGWGLLPSGLVLAVLGYAWLLAERFPAFYYSSLQEDEYLEWASFWAFLLAGALFLLLALRQRRSGRRLPWFAAGVGLFCVVVAMEEISWGQRLLGYRPPVYFLEHNFQQELNVHNVFATSLRKLALKATIGGYGVVLPLLALVAPLRRLFERLGIVAPPAALVPAFAAAFALYEVYPWSFSGEIVELLLGLGFLFSAQGALRGKPPVSGRTGAWRTVGVFVTVAGLGVGTAMLLHRLRGVDPERIAAAVRESESLREDFLALARRSEADSVTRCGVHKRLFTFVEEYDVDPELAGRFVQLTREGLPEERARYFLDPWNTPYWIRDRCRGDRRRILVYSFGPNRRRDSSRWEILGDDIGAVILSRGG